MKNTYVYILDTMADWELGYVIAELNSGRYFKPQAERIPVRTVGATNEPITTLGGMTIIPDTVIDAITSATAAGLLLPGADVWHEPKHTAVIEKAKELLGNGVIVAAICGATSALARAGLFDSRPHTSNSLDYLKMVAPDYRGEDWYQDQPVVADGNLITASSAGGLLFARYTLAQLDVFSKETLTAWYNYHHTGETRYFYELMQTLPEHNRASS
jgi:putative intracellular protease/amidase